MQSNRSSQSESGRFDFKSEAQSIIDAVRDDLAKRAVAVTSGAIFGFTGTVGGVTAAAAGGFKTTRSEEGLEQVDFRVQRNHHILNGELLAQSRGRDGSIELDPENEYLRGSGLIDENPQTPVELDPENEYLRGSGLIDEGQEGSGGSPRGNPRRNRDQGGGNRRGNNRSGNSAANEGRSRDRDGALVYNELKHPQFVTARKMNQWGDPKSPYGLGDIFNLEPLFGAPASGCYVNKRDALVKAAELYKNTSSTVTIGEC
jgi:hypothetical protein